jgi:L-amino acid N-acyltransferase YncA
MSIRSYQPTDLPACKQLYTELVQTHRELYHDETIGAPDPSVSFVNQLQQHGHEAFWVAEEDGKVVGLIGLIIEVGMM